jgi:alkaline phosphatase D
MGQTWNPELPADLRPALKKVKLIADDEQGPDWDQWDGYPVERDALLAHIDEHAMENVVVLSGDVHVSLAVELHHDPFHTTERPIAIEIVTPSLTSQNLDDKMGWARHAEESRAAERRAVEFLPHWEWVDLDSHGYVVIDVTPERLQAQFWHLDTVLERSPVQTRAAVWEVEHGSSRLTLVD